MTHPYATEAYARSLAHWGEALHVPEWGCSVIVRDIPQGGRDACGTYPLAILSAGADLRGGLERLRRLGLISVTLVVDDLCRPMLTDLQRCFCVVKEFKTHHIRRTGEPFVYGKHHRYSIKRAYRVVHAAVLDLASHAAEWRCLYTVLVSKHQLTGIHAFSTDYFEALHELPGLTAFGAWHEGRLVSAKLWVVDGAYVHSHLAASSAEGYQVGAAYAAYDASLSYFSNAAVVNLGGGAGIDDDPADGLAVFKRGFANASAPAYICGAILDDARYAALSEVGSQRAGAVDSDQVEFFPRYRAPGL